MKATLIALLGTIGCVATPLAFSQGTNVLAEAFKGLPISPQRTAVYEKGTMNERQKAAYEYEKQLIERENKLNRAANIILGGLSTKLPIQLSTQQRQTLTKFRAGTLSDKDTVEFKAFIDEQLEQMKGQMATVKAHMRENPVTGEKESLPLMRKEDFKKAVKEAGRESQRTGRPTSVSFEGVLVE